MTMKTLGEVAFEAVEKVRAKHKAYARKWDRMDPAERECCDAAADAVAAHVRAEDAARGGTLTTHEWTLHRDAVLADVRDPQTRTDLLAIFDHAAAQGRTIAARDARIAELEKALEAWPRRHDDNVGAYVRARDRAERAESALATLRQKVNDLAMSYRRPQSEHWEKWRAVYDAMATPSEHPDTATLRAQLSRVCDAVAKVRQSPDPFPGDNLSERQDFYSRGFADGWVKRGAVVRADVDAVLGDSGPSGGGESAEHDPDDVLAVCDKCGARAGYVGRSFLNWAHDACPNGGTWRERDEEPTTPPDVAAGETPTPEEDWRTVELALTTARAAMDEDTNKDGGWEDLRREVEEGISALARLRDEPRRAAAMLGKVTCMLGLHGTTPDVAQFSDAIEHVRTSAAEAMRERCAKAADQADAADAAHRIRDLPLL